jgi:putative endonuclease
MGKLETGNRGEAIAAAYLIRKHYAIVETNWRFRGGEIDIVARHNDMLVFVEVRSRSATTTEAAFATITPSKRQRLIRSAYAYINAHDLPESTSWRIDIIGIALPHGTVDHIEDALDW